MVKVTGTKVTVKGVSPSQKYIPIHSGTAMVSSSKELKVNSSTAQPAIVEVREDSAETLVVQN